MKYGVYIIGVMSILTLVLSAIRESHMLIKLDGITAVMFLIMLCKDCAKSRLALFVAFCIATITSSYARIQYVLEAHSQKPMARKFCYLIAKTLEDDGVTKEAWEKIPDYEDYYDCLEKLSEQLYKE